MFCPDAPRGLWSSVGWLVTGGGRGRARAMAHGRRAAETQRRAAHKLLNSPHLSLFTSAAPFHLGNLTPDPARMPRWSFNPDTCESPLGRATATIPQS